MMQFVSIDEVCEVIAGQSPPSVAYNQDGIGVPFFQGKADFGELNPRVRYWCSKPTKMSKPGDILFSVRAPVGPTNINNIDACIGRGLSALRCSNKIELRFLLHFLRANERKIASLGTGSTFKAITIKVLRELQIPLPPLLIQQKIAAILDAADELRQKDKALLKKYEELSLALFLEMFGDPTTNPKKWKWSTIKDSCELVKGITYSPEDVSKNGIIVLRSSNVQNSLLTLHDLVRITKKIHKRFWVQQNDILMCNRNGSAHLVGKVAKIPELSENMTFGTFMTIVRSEFHTYLYSFFQTQAFRRQIKMQTSVAINQISLPLLEAVKVPIPPIEMQQKFEAIVKIIDQQKALLEKNMRKSEELFNSLLQKAFNGELVPEAKMKKAEMV